MRTSPRRAILLVLSVLGPTLIVIAAWRGTTNAAPVHAAPPAPEPASSSSSSPQADAFSLSMVMPRPNGDAHLVSNPEGIFTFSLSGNSKGRLDSRKKTLLWIRPVKPAGEGYYLQRPPFGGISLQPDASWQGTAQVGSRAYPPQAGHIFDVRITMLEAAAANDLLNAPGVVVRPQPTGDNLATATNVRVVLQ